MKTIITIHPINQTLLEKLGIWQNTTVTPTAVGSILHTLIEHGYKDVHSYVTDEDGERTLKIHCKMDLSSDQGSYTLTYNHLDNKKMKDPLYYHNVEFQLFDDDGNLYFTGKMSQCLYNSHLILNPRDDAEAWGVTEMKIGGQVV